MDNSISDELIAAYIDGNTTLSENELIQQHVLIDSDLMETIEIFDDFNFNNDSLSDFLSTDEGYIPNILNDNLSDMTCDTNGLFAYNELFNDNLDLSPDINMDNSSQLFDNNYDDNQTIALN